MSRGGDYDFEEAFPGQQNLMEHAFRRALKGTRFRKALVDLCYALIALPEHRLISGALTTVGLVEEELLEDGGLSPTNWSLIEAQEKVAREGLGVCAVGAFAWHKLVKQGMTPEEAFAALPTLPDYSGNGIEATARYGESMGLTWSLAWFLADKNDESLEGCTPEERWQKFMDWIDNELSTV